MLNHSGFRSYARPPLRHRSPQIPLLLALLIHWQLPVFSQIGDILFRVLVANLNDFIKLSKVLQSKKKGQYMPLRAYYSNGNSTLAWVVV